MKKKLHFLTYGLVLVFALLCVTPASARKRTQAEKDTLEMIRSKQKINVKLNALTLLGIVNPGFEIKVWDYITIQMDILGVFYPRNFLGTGYPLGLAQCFVEPRYYPMKAFKGFFCAMDIGFGVYRMNKNIYPSFVFGYTQNPNTIHYGQALFAGISIGYNFNIGKHWGIELMLGGGYQHSAYESYTPVNGNEKLSSHLPWNRSSEWLPLFRGGVFVTYRF